MAIASLTPGLPQDPPPKHAHVHAACPMDSGTFLSFGGIGNAVLKRPSDHSGTDRSVWEFLKTGLGFLQ